MISLDDARHVLTRTARINEGGYVADCRDLVLAELDAALARLAELESTIKGTLEAVAFGHAVTLDSRLYRELLAALDAVPADES